MSAPNLLPKTRRKPRKIFQLFLGSIGLIVCFFLWKVVAQGVPLFGRATISTINTPAAPFPSIPISGPVTPQPIYSSPIDAPAAGTRFGQIRFSETANGRSFLISLPSQAIEVLSETYIPEFLYSLWIPGKQQRIIVAYGDSGDTYQWVDEKEGISHTLGSHILTLAVSPNGHAVAWLEEQEQGTALIVSNPDGSARTLLLHIRSLTPEIVWIGDSIIGISQESASGNARTFYSVSLSGTVTTILKERPGLALLPAPNGETVLISSVNSQGDTELSLLHLSSRTETPLEIPTHAKKCAWHETGTRITCGVPMQPTTLSSNARYATTQDDIITIDLPSKTRYRHYTSSDAKKITVTQPILVASDVMFVFLNTFDGKPYLLPIE